MTLSSIKIVEEFALAEEGRFICRVTNVVNKHYDNDKLFTIEGGAKISLQDSGSISGYGSSHIPYNVNCTLNTPVIFIQDLMVPPEVRGKGIARFCWHRIYTAIPPELRSRTLVYGRLVRKDEMNGNGKRRDQLWKDLCGFSNLLPAATFTPTSETSAGGFRGPITDPWQPFKSKLCITLLSSTNC